MKKTLSLLGHYGIRALTISLWFAMAVAAVVFLVHMTVVVVHPYSVDYGEGPLLDQAVRIHEGVSIYDPDLTTAPYTITNYPPLYVGILSLFNSAESAALWPGRLLSVLSTLGTGYLIYRIVLLAHKDRLAALLGGAFFLSFPFVLQWGAFMRIDNLALFISVAALFVIQRWPDEKRSLWITAVLLTAAAYTRQSYLLAAPLASFVWLLFRNWKRAFSLAALTTVMVGALFGVFMLLTNGGFFVHVVQSNVNVFDWATVSNYLDQFNRDYLIVTVVSGVFLFAGWKLVPQWRLVAPYLVGATLSALTVGKVGSNVNYLLELTAAMSMALGLTFSWLRSKEKTFLPWLNQETTANFAAILMVLLIVFQLRGNLAIDLSQKARDITYRTQDMEELDSLNDVFARQQGIVLVDEYMAMLPQNQQSIYIQPFEMTQMSIAGAWDQTPFLNEIAAQKFSQIIIHQYDYPVYLSRWTPEMIDAIMENYAAVAEKANSIVFEPITQGGPADERLVCKTSTGWGTPTSGEFGVYWNTRQIFIYGANEFGTVPVYAVADGLLYRFEGWDGAVAIQHDDPLNPGEKVWTFYGDMLHPWNGDDYVLEKFPQGSEAVPVQQGDLLGYQGSQFSSGAPNRAHLHFAVVPAAADGSFLTEWLTLTGAPFDYFPNQTEFNSKMLRPIGNYLNIVQDTSAGMWIWKPYRCAEAE